MYDEDAEIETWKSFLYTYFFRLGTKVLRYEVRLFGKFILFLGTFVFSTFNIYQDIIVDHETLQKFLRFVQ